MSDNERATWGAVLIISLLFTNFTNFVWTYGTWSDWHKAQEKDLERERMAIVRGFGEYDSTPPHQFHWNPKETP